MRTSLISTFIDLMASFIVDSNFFIQAHRSLYPLDVATSYWRKVEQLATDGKIVSIDKVKNEIYKNEDDLKAWCKSCLPSNFFQNTNNVITEYTQVVNWAVARNHYLQKALDEFLHADEADAWIVSYALSKRITVVTYELSEPNRKTKVKIPDVCLNLRVQYVNTMDMFRRLGETF